MKIPFQRTLAHETWVSGPKHSTNLDDGNFTIFVDHSEHNSVGKKSMLVRCKILRLSVNTLIADEKYSLLNRDNLMQPIQILWSQK